MDQGRRQDIRAFLGSPPFHIHDIGEDTLALYNQALTHSSYAKEQRDQGNECQDNERLEFLGNFVLDLVVSEYLYKNFYYSEGEMSQRMMVTSDEILAEMVRENDMPLEQYLLLGKATPEVSEKMVAGAMEALFGALYLGLGFEEVRKVILVLLDKKVKDFDPSQNFVGLLQEYAHSHGLPLPQYSEERIEGPDHNPVFQVTVRIKDTTATGKDKSKSSARKNAAKTAWERLQEHEGTH